VAGEVGGEDFAMTPRSRRLILARVLDPKYEHPKSMKQDARMERIIDWLLSDSFLGSGSAQPTVKRG
jgi:hypothetical protein